MMQRKKEISYFEIILLVIATFAFSYLIYESSLSLHAEEKRLDMEKSPLLKIYKAISKPMIPVVSAANATFGCCVDQTQGTYDNNVAQSSCKGKWYESPCNKIAGSANGCCVLGRETMQTTELHCQKRAEILGIEKEWKSNLTMQQCVELGKEKEIGACVSVSKSCTMVTKQQCTSSNASTNMFHVGVLCTEPALGTPCKKSKNTACFAGEDQIYYLDTCGNRANIYDSTKYDNDQYWRKVFAVKDSCNANSANGNADSKTCGNCNKFSGGFCAKADPNKIKPIYGENYCKPTSCIDSEGNPRKNGESWCVYDGKVDNIDYGNKLDAGKDTVGSRHWKQVCNMGEVNVEPCKDYRQEVCTQKKQTIQGKEVDYAECAYNPWRQCTSANSKSGGTNTVNSGQCDGKFCSKKTVAFDQFNFQACTPLWPPGFQGSGNPEKTNSDMCDTASTSCTVIYIKELSGCNPKVNKECEEQAFSDGMNEICRSLGDCGGYVNWLGKYTDGGYKVTNAPMVSLKNKYITYAKPLKIGQQEITPFYNETGKSYSIAAPSGQNPKAPKANNIFGIPPGALIAVGVVAGSGLVIGGIVAIFNVLAGIITAGVFLIAAIILFLIFFFLGLGKVCKKVTVNFKCKQWETPKGCVQADADKCNSDPLKPCSEYRCKSIGAACKIVNKGTKNEKCVPTANDGVPVVISADMNRSSANGTYTSVTPNGFTITNSNVPNGCVRAYTYLDLGILTNKLAECRYDFEEKDFKDMSADFKDVGNDSDGQYSTKHLTKFFLPEPAHMITYDPETGQFQQTTWNGDVTLYVKCSDVWGNENTNQYLIKSCVNPGPDVTPPMILRTIPESGSYIKKDREELTSIFLINEPAECKWSKENKGYDDMENNLTCTTTFDEGTDEGYICSTDLSLNDSLTSNYYVRCKDQPWLDLMNASDLANIGNPTRNTMTASFVYTLNKFDKLPVIESITPEGEIKTKEVPIGITLEAKTSGADGNLVCGWDVDGGYNYAVQMEETGGSTHTQRITSLNEGAHTLYVSCEDKAGDFAEKSSSIIITVDKSAPEITSLRKDGADISIGTNEPTECYTYGAACSGSESLIAAGFTTEHKITNAQVGKTYYIKCKDDQDNYSACKGILMSAG